MKKIGRNDPCPCGSGKKFKKCCEATMIGGRFKAIQVSPATTPQMTGALRLTSLFQNNVHEVRPLEFVKPIRPSAPPSQSPEQNEQSSLAQEINS